MEGFVVLLIILFLTTLSSKNKARQRGGASQDAPARPTAAPAPKPQPQARPVARMSIEERRARLEQLRQQRRARQQADAAEPAARPSAPQGVSLDDDEGCVGGTMPHDHSEGESRVEHAAHLAAMEARDAQEAAMAEPRGLAALDPRDLRRAVVISEILGKPKALQRRA